MSTELQDKIAKLPKWAQGHITQIERQRDAAIDTLNRSIDNQTETDIWFFEHLCTGEGGTRGPIRKKFYVPNHCIEIDFEGVRCTVLLREGSGIDITYNSSERHMAEVALVPRSYQQIYLISKQHMRNC